MLLSSVPFKGRQRWSRNRGQLCRSSFQPPVHLIIIMFAMLHPPKMVANGQEVVEATTEKKAVDGTKYVDVQKVEEYVKHYNNTLMTEFTFEQLQKWFEVRGDPYRYTPFSYPRAFPFCVTRNQIVQGWAKYNDQSKHNANKYPRVTLTSRLNNFERYFHGVELRRKRFYQFEPEKDSTKFNKSFIKEIQLTRINTPEPDMVNLRQWVHITVLTEERMAGLYLQAIVGPLGLPFGEFSLDFPCADSEESKDINTVAEINYCSYRPKTSLYHPTAYVAFDSEKKRNEFHVHFRWFDLSCMETPYIQFLMLVVKNKVSNPTYGVDYVAQVSPVYLNIRFDSKDGSPYPYYPGFRDNMWCFLQNQGDLLEKYKKIGKELSAKPKADRYYASIGWKESNLTRIQPNEQYDDCVLYDNITKPEVRDELTYECGPGPFKCDNDLSTAADVETPRMTLVGVETEVSECIPCGVPECTRIGFHPELCDVELPTINDFDSETNVLSSLDDNTRIRTHGVAGMLSILFFIPISNFVARFYKEVLGGRVFGNGPWVFVHLLCSMLAFAALWSSMGPLIPALATVKARERTCKILYEDPEDPDFEECLDTIQIRSPHTITGAIVYWLVHFIPFFGFVRPSSDRVRLIISAIHSQVGYFTYILGVVSVFLAIRNSCRDTIILCSILTALPFVFSIIAFILDLMSDNSLGVTPARKQWPVLEELQLDSRGPYEIAKLIVLVLFIVLMTVVWLLALTSLQAVTDSGANLADGKSDLEGKQDLGKLQGLFGPCDGGDGGNSEGTTTIAPL